MAFHRAYPYITNYYYYYYDMIRYVSDQQLSL